MVSGSLRTWTSRPALVNIFILNSYFGADYKKKTMFKRLTIHASPRRVSTILQSFVVGIIGNGINIR